MVDASTPSVKSHWNTNICISMFQWLFNLARTRPCRIYLCSNDFLNLAWTRTCLRIFVFRSLFLTWRGRVHAIYICYNIYGIIFVIYFFTWHECVHACHCCHGRVHAKLKKSLEHKYTMARMSPRQAKFKRSLEHKYTMAWTRPRQV
jgi:hypothetical protein